MALPLLALGLLGGALGQEWWKNRQSAQLAEGLGPLLGQAPQPMGPEGPQGQMGMSGGSGLLADPADPSKQMEFARGVLALPGGQRALAQFDPMLGRALQSRQWTQSQERQSEQFQQSEARLTDQFAKQFGLSQENAALAAQEFGVRQQQWERNFAQQQAEAEVRRRNEAARLGMEQQRLALETRLAQGKLTEAQGLPKLSANYMYAPSASGIVAMPIPGSQDYAKGVQGEKSMVEATQQINDMLDIYMGREQVTPAGKKIRMGGSGTELWGENAARMSTIRGQIIANVAVLRNMGVLQGGELENIEKMLPDPTAWSGPFQRNKSTTAAYKELQRQFEQKLVSHREANPWLLPAPPPGTVSVSK